MPGPRRAFARSSIVVAVILLVSLGGANALVHAASPVGSSSNWEASSYDYQNTNNSPQGDINVDNVQYLQPVWIYQVPVNPYSIPGAPPALGIEAQSIVVHGTAYVATPYNRIIALNTANGNKEWDFQVNMSKFIGQKWWSGAYVISGISYYNETIYVMASDTAVYAINALNGTEEWEIPPVAANILGNTGTYYGEKAPILVGDNLLVRASTTDYGGRGFVAAYNVHTRNMSWIWYTVPPATGTGDPNWDSKDVVTLANETTVNYGQPQGNVTPYPGDWGTTPQSVALIGGGAAWGLMAVDNKTGVVYFSTGHPSGGYDASLRPGPNLYTDCLIALNTTNGKMLWYYQMTSHDITEHEGGWSVSLSNITVNGTSVQVVVQGSKDNGVYVINAATGKPVYAPIRVGPKSSNSWNDGLTSTANLTASQRLFGSKDICPGPDGGIEMAPAIDGNTLFLATQNACGLMTYAPNAYPYKGKTINGYIYTDDPAAQENGTVYAIDLSTGQPIWHYNIPNRYQGSSAVVSGGVLYVIDRAGILYMFNEQTGALLKSFELNGIGAAGVSIALDTKGVMTLFAPAGGGDLGGATPGVVVAYNVVCPGGTGSSCGGAGGPVDLEQPIIIVLGVVVVILVMYTLLKRRTPTRAHGSPPRTRAL